MNNTENNYFPDKNNYIDSIQLNSNLPVFTGRSRFCIKSYAQFTINWLSSV